MRIVLIFMVLFTPFPTLSATNLMDVIQTQPVSGGYAVVRTRPGSEIRFLEQRIESDAQGFAAVPFGRDVAGMHDIVVHLKDGTVQAHPIWIESRHYEVQRVEGVDMSRVTPPDSVTERIQREAALVWRARAAGLELPNWRSESFVRPVEGPVTGVYGSERYYNGIPRSPHWGIDYAAPKGTAVKAPAGGTVVLAEPDLYYSGGTIVVDHGGGLTSSFLHLSRLLVRPGDVIAQGDIIAEVGSTGRSTGPHLDWRMNLHGERVDAALWLNP